MMKEFAPQLKSDSLVEVFSHPNPIWEYFFSGPGRFKRLDYPEYYASQVPQEGNLP